MKVEHVLLFLIGAFLVYHMMGKCGCKEGFGLGDGLEGALDIVTIWKTLKCHWKNSRFRNRKAKSYPSVREPSFHDTSCRRWGYSTKSDAQKIVIVFIK